MTNFANSRSPRHEICTALTNGRDERSCFDNMLTRRFKCPTGILLEQRQLSAGKFAY